MPFAAMLAHEALRLARVLRSVRRMVEEDPEWSSVEWAHHVRRTVGNLLGVLDDALPRLTRRHDADLLPRQMAAAGVARCRALLLGMEMLEEGRPDVMGLLQRNLWEVTMTALYLLLGGPDAVNRLYGQHARQVRSLV